MRRWQAADRDYRCGYDWCLIRKGDAMQVIHLGHVARVRCLAHASGPVDWDQVNAPAAPVTAQASSWQPIKGLARQTRRDYDAKARQAGGE